MSVNIPPVPALVPAAKTVCFNVGGTRFQIERSLLNRLPHGRLAGICKLHSSFIGNSTEGFDFCTPEIKNISETAELSDTEII